MANGYDWEADPKLGQIYLEEIGLTDCKLVDFPVAKSSDDHDATERDSQEPMCVKVASEGREGRPSARPRSRSRFFICCLFTASRVPDLFPSALSASPTSGSSATICKECTADLPLIDQLVVDEVSSTVAVGHQGI